MNRSEERILKNKKLKRRKRMIKRIFLFLIIFFALLFGIKKAGVFNVNNVLVKGPKGAPVKEIIKESGFVKGRGYFSMSKKSRIKSIEKIPNVKNVKISFSPRKVATISVSLREPKVQIIGSNKVYIIDDEFKVIRIDNSEVNDLMRVEGLKTNKFALGKFILSEGNDQRKLLSKIFSDSSIYSIINTLVVAKYESTFYTKDDIKVALGTYTDLDYKFKMLNLIMKDIHDTGKEVVSIEMEKGPDPIVIMGKHGEKENKKDSKDNNNETIIDSNKNSSDEISSDNKEDSSKKDTSDKISKKSKKDKNLNKKKDDKNKDSSKNSSEE